ncbi:MAG: hypothetical protein LBJ67_02925 [Planctomycetaceae bacterium]|jgi:hypothetical protein|nr:hypothetical protein [Planctomycetaceae bacterium]
MRIKNFIGLMLILFAVLLTGCGKSDGRIAIRGNITLDNIPLADGTITFFPTGGGSGVSSGGSIQQGYYTSDLMPGKYVVQITANRKTGKMLPSSPGDPPLEEFEQYIPTKYNKKSELTIDVENKSKQTFDFALESK